MTTIQIEVPEDLLPLLERSPLGTHPEEVRVRLALSVLLFQQGIVSAGKAAELAGEPRSDFELLLGELGIPIIYYDEAEYERDLRGFAAVRARAEGL